MSNNEEINSSDDELINLFRCSLFFIASRGYPLLEYDKFLEEPTNENQYTLVDIYQTIKSSMKKQLNYSLIKSSNIKNIDSLSSSKKKELLSYYVFNRITGKRTLVLFYSSSSSINSELFSNLISGINQFTSDAFGESNSCSPNINFNCIIITKSELGANPKEKARSISNIEFFDEKIILSRIYDNVFQSQINEMTKEEKTRFLSNPSILLSELPTYSLSQDSFFKYRDFSSGSLLEIFRGKISSEETLNASLFIRRVLE